MHLECVNQTHVSFICGLKACGNLDAIDKGREIHMEAFKRGLEADVSVGSTLVDMYAKCGSLIEARNVFDNLPLRDIVAWNAMIKGYGLNHNGCKFLQLFLDMENEGVLPNSVTFICIFTACSHNSLVIEGQKYFEMMIKKYGITPSLEHLSCIIDLFARSGSLSEAEKFLESLPFSSSKDVWLPLLTASKTYAEVDLGYKCFQKLLDIDPDCASSYTLMSSIYASIGKGDDVAN
jgi:pentatricopeptide repeat protein